jgi:hypothetical protein
MSNKQEPSGAKTNYTSGSANSTQNKVVIEPQSDSVSSTDYTTLIPKNIIQSTYILRNNNPSKVSQKIWEILKGFGNKEQINQVNTILEIIEPIINSYKFLELPEVSLSTSVDNSIAINWQVGNASLGIAIQPNTEESSWFLLMGKNSKALTAYGYLNLIDKRILFDSMVNMINKIQMGEKNKYDSRVTR